jgi:hypothetical protein
MIRKSFAYLRKKKKKILGLHLCDQYDFFPYLDRWLHDAVTPGIEELTLKVYKKYSFPCSANP